MNPTLRIHTHCQVAQARRTIQNLSKSMAAPTLKETKKNKHGHTTMAIRNAGFGGNLKVTAINKTCGRLKGLRIQIPHSA